MGLAEVVFAGVCVLVLAAIVRGQVLASRALTATRAHADHLASTDPVEAARRAVREERERLSREISSGFAASLDAFSAASSSARDHLRAGTDPSAALASVHLEARRTTSELRRQLGLLRPAGVDRPVLPPALPAPGSRRRPAPLLAAATVALAGVEASSQTRADGGVDLVAVTLAVTAAAATLGHRVAPAASATAISATYLVAVLLGHRVPGGFWMIIALGGVAWMLVQRATGPDRVTAAWVLMAATVTWSTWVLDPDNVAAAVVLLVVVTVASGVLRATRGRERVSAAAVAAHRARLARAHEDAARDERLALARDLHDAVSHAVAVVAVQASAASVTWRTDPAAAVAALDVVDDAIARARRELGSTAGGSPVDPRRSEGHAGAEDTGTRIDTLVERAREAGVDVRLHGPSLVAGPAGPVVHRVVQESLTNVLRHARGARVDVTVDAAGDVAEVVVEDDGPGMREHATPGFGLVGLRERVELVGGSLVVGPGARGGHRVHARLPVAPVPSVLGGELSRGTAP